MRGRAHWKTDFFFASVRSKAIGIEKDVHKRSIITDPKVHFDMLRFCQHTHLALLARNLPPDTTGTVFVIAGFVDRPLSVPPRRMEGCVLA